MPLDEVPDDVKAIVDVKCPGSGEATKMHWPNLDQLSAHDEVKFVIADRADFDYAADVTARHRLIERDGGRAVFTGARRAAIPPTWCTGFSSRVCRYGCSCRRTSTSGAPRRGASDGVRIPRRRPSLRRARFDDGRGVRAARRLVALRAHGAVRPGASAGNRRRAPRSRSRSASASTSSSTSTCARSAVRRSSATARFPRTATL